MSDLKITVDQLKNYLGTGLKVTFDGDEYEHDLIGIDLTNEGIHIVSPFGDFGRSEVEKIRPICYLLSDLDKEIEHNSERFVPEKELKKITKFSLGDKAGLIQFNGLITSFLIMQKLFEWHFWPFGDEYFTQGLVIDKRKEACNG